MTQATKKQTPKIYSPPKAAMRSAKDEILNHIIQCSICRKRAIDISELPDRPIKLRHKCPHCKNLIVTALAAASIKCVEIT